MKPARPLKVLQIINSFGMGGAETWLMELLRLWSKDKTVQMDFLLTGGSRGIFDEEAERLGARLHYLRYGRSHILGFVGKFRRILREGQYDAIHDHGDYVSGLHFITGLGVLPKIRIAHVHNPWLHISANYAVTPRHKLMTMIGRRLVWLLATDVCGTSAAALNKYGFGPGHRGHLRTQVVHCGIDVAKFNAPREADRESVLREFGFEPDAKIVLFAGRLDRAMEFNHPQNHKNSWFALHVAKTALEIDRTVRLLMAGAGDSRTQLEDRITDWGFQKQLRLLGVRKDMPRLMRAADVLLFPSQQEGLGMVAVEAQAACLPVLASTAVPRECVVIPELFDALALHEPIDLWTKTLLKKIIKPRPAAAFCRSALESSAFSILNSARNIEKVYRGMER